RPRHADPEHREQRRGGRDGPRHGGVQKLHAEGARDGGQGKGGLWFSRQRAQWLADKTQLAAERDHLQQRSAEQTAELQNMRVAQVDHQSQLLDLQAKLSAAQTESELAQQQIGQADQLMNSLREQLQGDFAKLAQQSLQANGQQLVTRQEDTLRHLLDPLKERLTAFEKRVEASYAEEARERFGLQKEIKQLAQLNQLMSEEAQKLTKALKGDSKVQGNWGELVLRRVLESSGLREGEEFVVQGKELQLKDQQGNRFQPDVVVNLPDGKHLIVDAKVSLTAYERLVGEEESKQQQLALKEHVQSIQTHIRQLSDKHYAGLTGLNAPDFVLLFLPMEAAFSVALQEQPNLFQQAWDRRIIVVSPTTLLATLKTVASLWKLEQQNRNAEEIARQGGNLYDKLVGFVEEMESLGKHLQRAEQAHQKAMNQLRDGRGSLTRRAEKLRELGINHRKSLPPQQEK
ncbi:MAG: DNA recombination protein RmuC, partial [Bacteroidota bacterium]